MTRLLLIGASTPQCAIEWSYLRAFRELGVAVTLLDPERELRRLARGRILARFAQSLQHAWVAKVLRDFLGHTANWDVVLVFKGMFISANTLSDAMARTPRALWLCFNPDSPFAMERGSSSAHVRAALPLYHTYLIWSHALIPAIRRAGARDVVYVPFAADSSVHFPATERDRDPGLQHTVTFVGSHDATRAELLESIADLPLRVYGNAWNRLSRDSKLRDKVVHRSIFDRELRRVVSSSAVSLNILRRQNAGAHNMRSFELPAMNAAMVTSRSREQAEWFPEREACLMYDDKAELRKVVESLLSDPAAREQLRAAGLQRARAHTYVERARSLLEIASARR